MRQEDTWNRQYEEWMEFMRKNKRRPSKYVAEERQMVNWLKYNKKMKASGKMSPERLEKFKQLQDTAAELRRLNQYAYATLSKPDHVADLELKIW